MALAAEAKLDPVVNQALALQPRADTGIVQQIDAALFQHACPNAMLDIVASTILDHRRFDPLPLQQMSEQLARRPGADDPDLRAHGRHCDLGPG
jgi:hypothetical protein